MNYSKITIQLILKHAEKSSDSSLRERVWSDTDTKGNTAHHLAAETQNCEILKVCINRRFSYINEVHL